MRLIDADTLKKAVNGISTHWLNDWSTIGVLSIIDKQPTVDAVEVVRCKDCKWWKDDSFCAFDCNKSYREDFFCADGEREEEDE